MLGCTRGFNSPYPYMIEQIDWDKDGVRQEAFEEVGRYLGWCVHDEVLWWVMRDVLDELQWEVWRELRRD